MPFRTVSKSFWLFSLLLAGKWVAGGGGGEGGEGGIPQPNVAVFIYIDFSTLAICSGALNTHRHTHSRTLTLTHTHASVDILASRTLPIQSMQPTLYTAFPFFFHFISVFSFYFSRSAHDLLFSFFRFFFFCFLVFLILLLRF